MPSGYIDIKSSDGEGEFKGYFTSRPYLSDLPRPPGIVIIQEIFGVLSLIHISEPTRRS